MPRTIEDGTGSGKRAKVDEDNRLLVRAFSEPYQHEISHSEEQGYQVWSVTTPISGTVVCLHIKNNDNSRDMVFSFIRFQAVDMSGGTAFPNVNNYFSASFGRVYSSGGTTVSPINILSGSGNSANVTVYKNGPTLTGTATEFDRWYVHEDGQMKKWNKQGALIIPVNKTMEISYVGDHTSGGIYVRASFVMMKGHS